MGTMGSPQPSLEGPISPTFSQNGSGCKSCLRNQEPLDLGRTAGDNAVKAGAAPCPCRPRPQATSASQGDAQRCCGVLESEILELETDDLGSANAGTHGRAEGCSASQSYKDFFFKPESYFKHSICKWFLASCYNESGGHSF